MVGGEGIEAQTNRNLVKVASDLEGVCPVEEREGAPSSGLTSLRPDLRS